MTDTTVITQSSSQTTEATTGKEEEIRKKLTVNKAIYLIRATEAGREEDIQRQNEEHDIKLKEQEKQERKIVNGETDER